MLTIIVVFWGCSHTVMHLGKCKYIVSMETIEIFEIKFFFRAFIYLPFSFGFHFLECEK